jgi:sec-independent protein translocase protein TatC
VKLRSRTPAGAEGDNAQMALMDHLRELRNRIIKCAVSIVFFGIICYLFYDQIFEFFTHPYCVSVEGTNQECTLYAFDILGGFLLRMKVAGIGGLVLSVPVILYQLWRFVVPGLYKNERRYTIMFVAGSSVLFAFGAVMAYYTLPPMITWLQGNGGPVTYVTAADKYFWLTALMVAAFGVGFEFPIVLIALQLVGVLEPSTLAGIRRQAACGIVIGVAVLTPGGDPISLLALSIPMYLFYELSILIGRIVVRRRQKNEALDPAA